MNLVCCEPMQPGALIRNRVDRDNGMFCEKSARFDGVADRARANVGVRMGRRSRRRQAQRA